MPSETHKPDMHSALSALYPLFAQQGVMGQMRGRTFSQNTSDSCAWARERAHRRRYEAVLEMHPSTYSMVWIICRTPASSVSVYSVLTQCAYTVPGAKPPPRSPPSNKVEE